MRLVCMSRRVSSTSYNKWHIIRKFKYHCHGTYEEKYFVGNCCDVIYMIYIDKPSYRRIIVARILLLVL